MTKKLADTRSRASNNSRFSHFFSTAINNITTSILKLTITDCKVEDKLIHCSYGLKYWARMHNNVAIEKFVTPENLKDKVFNRFSIEEKELILACDAYNSTIKYYGCESKKLIKVTMGTKIGILVKDAKTDQMTYSFELDQSKFSGLLRKYRHEGEIREIIRKLFTL